MSSRFSQNSKEFTPENPIKCFFVTPYIIVIYNNKYLYSAFLWSNSKRCKQMYVLSSNLQLNGMVLPVFEAFKTFKNIDIVELGFYY